MIPAAEFDETWPALWAVIRSGAELGRAVANGEIGLMTSLVERRTSCYFDRHEDTHSPPYVLP